MSYNPTTWVNGVTPNNATNLNKIEQGIAENDKRITAQALPIANNRVAIDELLAYTGVTSQVSQTDSVFYDFPLSTKQLTSGIFDFTKAYCASVTTGVNTVTVSSMIVNAITDFKVGQEITLQDASGKETLIIQFVADPVITFTTNIVGTYSSGANVYRSNLKVNGSYWVFGGFSDQTTIDYSSPTYPTIRSGIAMNITDTQVNRHTATLDLGEMIHISASSGVLSVYHSTDNGATWAQLTFVTDNVSNGKFGIVKNGRELGIFYGRTINETTLRFLKIDYDTVTNTEQVSNVVTIDTVALLRREAGISYVNGKYWILSNGYVSSTPVTHMLYESADGVTWTRNVISGAVEVLQGNRLSCDASLNDKPVFLEETFTSAGSLYKLWVRYWNGSSWASTEITDFGTSDKILFTYDRFLDPGKIAIAVTIGSPSEIYYIEWDNGVLSSQIQVTSGSAGNNTFIAVLVNNSDVPYVSFRKSDASLISCNKSDNFVAKTTLKSSVTQFVNFEGLNFSTHPLVHYTSGVSQLDLLGVWVVGTETAITEVDVRLNGESFENVDSIASWLYSNNVTGVTLDASLSVHASGANEVYTDLADVEIDIDASNNYYVSTGSVATPNKEFTVKYELARPTTGDDVRFTRVQGGVA